MPIVWDIQSRWYIAVVHGIRSIRRTDCRWCLADMCTTVDDGGPHNGRSLRKSPNRTRGDKHDSSDRRLHRRDNLRCTGTHRAHRKSLDYPAYLVDKCSWHDGSVPNIRRHGRIVLDHACMDSSISRCNTPYRTDSQGQLCIRLYMRGATTTIISESDIKNGKIFEKKKYSYVCSIEFVDHHPIPMGNSTVDDAVKHDIQHCRRMDYDRRMDCGSAG